MSTDDQDERQLLARALFSFNGKNNDELTFDKNDIITVCQKLDGGWWEGTLNGQTGWFPSNYVQTISDHDKLMRSSSVPNASAAAWSEAVNGGKAVNAATSRNQFKAEVLREFLTTEKLYIANLNETFEEFLLPIRENSVLSEQDWLTLSCNFESIVKMQSNIFNDLQNTLGRDSREQRVGGILLSAVKDLKNMLLKYCSNHPRAVEVVNEKESELNGFVSSRSKEMRRLISGLSEPFRHLEKYPIFLSELERCVSDDHPDRGDILRASVVYRDMKSRCEAERKQKETQLELLYTGQVEQWASFEERGKICYVCPAAVLSENDNSIDRYLAVFAKVIIILEITPSINVYNLIQKIKTDGLAVKRWDDGLILTTGRNVLRLMLSSSATDDLEAVFSKMTGVEYENTVSPTSPKESETQPISMPREIRPPAEAITVTPRRKPSSTGMNNGIQLNHELEMILPEGIDDNLVKSTSSRSSGRGFLPKYPGSEFSTPNSAIKMRKEIYDEDDAVLLRIVEGYCKGVPSAPKPSIAADSPWKQPQLIVAEQEKILMEEVVDGETVFQEKTLVDTVYSLNSRLAVLSQQVASLSRALEREQRARRRLEEQIRPGIPQTTSP